MREISKELKEAKKELFKVSSKSVIAHAKVVGITALSCMVPITYCVCTNAAFAKVANDMTTEDNYVEEVITDNKGNEEVIYITKEERGDNFIRVYDKSTETENGYDTSYVEYSGDQVTVNTLNILDSYSVPADMLLVDGQEKQDIISTPVEDDYMIQVTYRDSDKTYIRPVQKGDKALDNISCISGINSALNSGGMYFSLRYLFILDKSLLNKLHRVFEIEKHLEEVNEKKQKVKTLKKELKMC